MEATAPVPHHPPCPITLGAIFPDHSELRNKLTLLAAGKYGDNAFGFSISRSEPSSVTRHNKTRYGRYIARCSSDNCTFQLHAKQAGDATAPWTIIKFECDHTCLDDGLPHRNPLKEQAFLLQEVPNLLTIGPEITPAVIIDVVQKRFGRTISYKAALLCKQELLWLRV